MSDTFCRLSILSTVRKYNLILYKTKLIDILIVMNLINFLF